MISVNCAVVGDHSVRKSALLHEFYIRNKLVEYPWIQQEIYIDTLFVENQNFSLSLLDTKGQSEYDKISPICNSMIDIFLLCFSLVDYQSFKNIKKKWIPEIKKYCPNTPFILVGLK